MSLRSVLLSNVYRTGLVSALMLSGNAVLAGNLPTGGTIASGSATLTYSGNTLTVQQNSPKLVINWNSYDIANGYSVVYVQPGTSSSVLNDVLGSSASGIYGVLAANGQVILVNPAGITFGATAQVNAGSLIASTLKLSDTDFLAGNLRFVRGDATGAIVNQGSLTAEAKGFVALLAPEIRNLGVISANLGTVALASGDAVSLKLSDGRLVGLEVDPATVTSLIENKQMIRANGGLVLMSAVAANELVGSTINNSGTIEASSLTDSGGEIRLTGAQTITSSGSLDASGATGGGTVVVESSGTTLISGDVSAQGGSGTGGTVHLLGDKVGLLAGAAVDVSGDTGGGTVLVGGGAQGQDSSVKNATSVYMDQNASINASALVKGGGGKVVLWSNAYTGFYGSVTAKGGVLGGAGGSLETSSAINLQAMGNVDLSAPKGSAGSWLLDPSDITISSADSNTSSSTASGTDIFTATASSGTVAASTIESALNAGTNVTVSTTSSSAGNGDITVNANISKTSGGAASLLLSAARNILVNAGRSISSTSGALNVTLQANNADTGGGIAMNSGSSILSNGGNIVLGGGSNIATGYATGLSTSATGVGASGIVLYGATLNSAGGNITIRGKAGNGSGDAWGDTVAGSFGIQMQGGTINSGSGTISMIGVTDCTSCTYSHAVEISPYDSNSVITSSSSAANAITILADSTGSTANGDSNALMLNNTAVISETGTGGISLTGKANGYAPNAYGILLDGAQIEAVSGAITLTATTNKTNGTALNVVGTNYIGGAAGTAITSSSSNITINADRQSWNSISSLKSSGTLLIAPTTPSASIGIGGSSGSILQLGSAFFSALKSGFSKITIGKSSDTGTMTVNGAVNVSDKLELNSGSGTLTVNSAVTGGSDVTLISGSNIILNNRVTSGGTAVFAAAGHFLNNVGSSAVNAARWLIYSAGSSGDHLNGLSADRVLWNTNYGTTPPSSIGGSDNVLIYGEAAPKIEMITATTAATATTTTETTSIVDNPALTPTITHWVVPVMSSQMSVQPSAGVSVAEIEATPVEVSSSIPQPPSSPVPSETQMPVMPTVPAPSRQGGVKSAGLSKTGRQDEDIVETPEYAPTTTLAASPNSAMAPLANPADSIAEQAHDLTVGRTLSPETRTSAEGYYAQAMTKALAAGKTPAEAARLAKTALQDFLASAAIADASPESQIAQAVADAERTMTAESAKRFSTVLGRELARGKSMKAALTAAQASAGLSETIGPAEAALLALSSGHIEALLAPYSQDSVRSAFMQTLAKRLQQGAAPLAALTQAQQTAHQMSEAEAAAKASPMGRLADGEIQTDGANPQALAKGLAAGLSLDQAKARAKAAQVPETVERKVETLIPETADPALKAAFSRALASGKTPEQALRQARQVQQGIQSPRTMTDALSSGADLEQSVAAHTNGMTKDQKALFQKVVGAALATGENSDAALQRGLKAARSLAQAANLPDDPLAALPPELRRRP